MEVFQNQLIVKLILPIHHSIQSKLVHEDHQFNLLIHQLNVVLNLLFLTNLVIIILQY